MVLGNMITKSLRKISAGEFRKVCQKVLPLATTYLGGDLLDNFIKSPAGRTKSVIQNLITVVGWVDAKGVKVEDYRLPFIEEIYRREFTKFFHGKPQQQSLDYASVLIYSKGKSLESSATDADLSMLCCFKEGKPDGQKQKFNQESL